MELNSNRNQIGILSGYSPSSGGFNNSLSKLRKLAYIDGGGDNLKITHLGIDNAGDHKLMPQGKELHQYWINKLPKCEGIILNQLIEIFPESCSKIELAGTTKYSANSGGFNNALSKLRTLELISGSGQIKATESLF